MSVGGPCIALFRERIRSLQSAGIDKIWMKVSGDGDFTMANVLEFMDADLILLLKTTGLRNANNSIKYQYNEHVGHEDRHTDGVG